MILVKDGKKVKIDCADIWGFVYGDALFRMDQRLGHPTRVMSVGKICYYENGIAHLNMIKHNTESGNFSVGYFCYVSKDLGSEIIPMEGGLLSEGRKKTEKFKEEHPQYAELFQCIEQKYNYQNVRPCIDEFEGESSGQKGSRKGDFQKN